MVKKITFAKKAYGKYGSQSTIYCQRFERPNNLSQRLKLARQKVHQLQFLQKNQSPN